MSIIRAFNPTAPITTEAEAEAAARSSAISIFIGVVVGIIGIVWTLMNPGVIDAAVAQAGAESEQAAAMARTGAQMGLWLAGLFVVAQVVFGVIQWKSPKKWIAILFMVLIVLGALSTAATPLMAGLAPNTPVTPTWQIVLSIAIMIVQLILHIAGLRGINRLESIQMDAAR